MRSFFLFLIGCLFSVQVSSAGLDGIGSGGSDYPEFLKEFSVYPNPTLGSVTLTIRATDPNEALTMKVYNLIGQEMDSEFLTPYNGIRQIEFDLGKYPKGIYMIEISNGKESKVKRVSLI